MASIPAPGKCALAPSLAPRGGGVDRDLVLGPQGLEEGSGTILCLASRDLDDPADRAFAIDGVQNRLSAGPTGRIIFHAGGPACGTTLTDALGLSQKNTSCFDCASPMFSKRNLGVVVRRDSAIFGKCVWCARQDNRGRCHYAVRVGRSRSNAERDMDD